jgi:hypothetical protein
METTHHDKLAERLTRLEDENRRMRRTVARLKVVAVALAVVILLPIGMGAFQGPPQITASGLRIVDQQTGRNRVTIGANPDNGFSFVLLEDQAGNDHIQIASDWRGGSDWITVFDGNGTQRVRLGAQDQNAGVFVDGKPAVTK